jgi:hypothetical protein
MRGDLSQLMKKAQQAQKSLEKAKEEIARLEITGESGGGLVKVRMTGNHDVRSVVLDPEVLKEDKAMVEDLIAAAMNDAVRRVAKESQERIAGVTAGLNLPPGINPFS